jgi:hypothetical protein
MMLQIKTVPFILFFVFVALGCQKGGTVEFSGDRLISGALEQSQEIDVTNGGAMHTKTAGNYTGDVSFGSKTNQVDATTASGYRVRMHIQGQMIGFKQ